VHPDSHTPGDGQEELAAHHAVKPDSSPDGSQEATETRRTFLATTTSLAMTGGLLAGYGTFAYMAGRFLYPASGQKKSWLFVAEANRIEQGKAMRYALPSGQGVTIRRRGSEGTAADFQALSSVCPHLGCQVHWEQQNNRFFCPCHNGVFDPEGKAVAGPPADAGQSLMEYKLMVENGLLFIEAPV
jgi:Rieske Fe-S protein